MDAQELSKLDGKESYTLSEAFPRRLVGKLPKRRIAILVSQMTFGRPSKGSEFIPVVIRGTVARDAPGLN